jgi:predicted nucleic acid-binding protein
MINKKLIAVDSSSLIAYFQGQKGADVEKIEKGLEDCLIVLPPIVLSELLSDPKLPKEVVKSLTMLPALEITDGYWQRSGITRSKLIAKKLKAILADTLIAQICIDHNTSLITRDSDFKNFQKYCGLKIF